MRYSIIYLTLLLLSVKICAQNISTEERWQRASYLYDKKQYSAAVSELKILAESGFDPAQNLLGFCYEKGYGVEKKYETAASWYLFAAMKGNTDAQCNLAIYYASLKDFENAKKWYSFAAVLGNERAQNNLGIMFMDGLGVNRDDAEANFWLYKAAEQGYMNSQYLLGLLYSQGRVGLKQKPDWSRASYYHTLSANQGYVQAQRELGYYYENVEQIPHKAFYWYYKSAEQGDAMAQYNLARCYLFRIGTNENVDSAQFWSNRSHLQGFNKATMLLALITNSKKDKILLYQEAANNGDKYAQVYLGSYYYQKAKYKDAFALFEKSAQQDLHEAEFNLGYCYFWGYGTNKDLYKAALFFRKAADGNIPKAQYFYGLMCLSDDNDESWATNLVEKDYGNGNTLQTGYRFLQKASLAGIEEAKKKLDKLDKLDPRIIDIEEWKRSFRFGEISEKRYALVIGNSNYKSMDKLPNAINDANLIGDKLKQRGFNTTICLDVKSSIEFEDSLAAFTSKANDADIILLYYAGHASEYVYNNISNNYIEPTNFSPRTIQDIENDCIKLSEIIKRLSVNENCKVIVIMDACRSIHNNIHYPTQTIALPDEVSNNTLIVFSTGKGNSAMDDYSSFFSRSEHSPFAVSLYKNLKRSNLDIYTLFNDVAIDVYDKTSHKQKPEILGNIGNFIFSIK